MTSHTADLEEKRPLRLKGALTKQLTEIANAHGGQVPLHGRLFAQWLHYAFPHECPFPHRAGALKPRTQGERIAQGEALFIEEGERHSIIQGFEVQNVSEVLEEEIWSWDEEVMH